MNVFQHQADPLRHLGLFDLGLAQHGYRAVSDLNQLSGNGLCDPMVVIGKQPDQRPDLSFRHLYHK